MRSVVGRSGDGNSTRIPRKAKKLKITEVRSTLNNLLIRWPLVERELRFIKKDSRGRLERGVSVSRDQREKERRMAIFN